MGALIDCGANGGIVGADCHVTEEMHCFINVKVLITMSLSGICGVGKMMKIWKYWEDSACLSCGEPVEMTYHMVLCPCMERMLAWEEAINGLEVWMVEVEMDPDI